ncbi:YbaB/EbfC family nucleoid-associated protein [Actinoplanes sp. NPDC020271]|uniref:YbaB/EbfC family nucleoid-associated protein n=1 Tax=Actinoplanes sp. NPDC020271 TaxID=3363896 RepID=UPI003789680C
MASEPLLEPGMALERLAAWHDDMERLVTRTRAMSDRLGALRITASDPRRLVELTIDTQGALTDLRFGPGAIQHGPDTLARTVLATLNDARRQAAEQTRRIILESIGPDSAAAREMLTRMADRLGRPGSPQ